MMVAVLTRMLIDLAVHELDEHSCKKKIRLWFFKIRRGGPYGQLVPCRGISILIPRGLVCPLVVRFGYIFFIPYFSLGTCVSYKPKALEKFV